MYKNKNKASQVVYKALVENHLSNLIETIPGYMYVKDINLVYLACNKNFAQVAGLSDPKEILGKTDYDLPWGETEAKTFRNGDLEVLAGSPKVNFEEPQHQADGKEKIVLANKVPLYDENKKIVGVLGTYVDITSLKETNKGLQKAKEQAEESNRLKSDFVANVSHDFRTPLSTILGMAEAALLANELDRYKECVATIFGSGKHLLSLVEDIIEYYQLEQNNYRSRVCEYLLTDLIEDIEEVVRYRAENKNISLIIKNEIKGKTIIEADCKAIKRVLINLVDNAIKFTEKGYVELCLSIDKSEKHQGQSKMIIVIKDTGVGIKKSDQKKIFDRFSRLSPSYMNQHVSTGLGLTIVKQLLQSLGGCVSLKSVSGKGTEFLCEIPVNIKQEVEKKEAYFAEGNGCFLKGNVKNVLVVEDVFQVRRMLELLLKELGAKVTFAACGKEALTKDFNDYDLVLMDLGLGDMTGIEVVEKAVRKNKIKTPIVALTAHARKNDKIECINSGMSGFITKPVLIDDLREIIEEFC